MKKQKKDKDMEYLKGTIRRSIDTRYEDHILNLWGMVFGIIFTSFLVAGFITLKIQFFVGAIVFYVLTTWQY